MPEVEILEAIERKYTETDLPLSKVMTSDGRFDLYPDVRKFFSFSSKEDKLTLLASNYVGLIPLNARVALRVEPKIARENWLYIVGKAEGYLKGLAYLRDYSLAERASDSLTEFLARALILQMATIEHQGLYRRYQGREEITSFPRGRILIDESIKKV
jgi:5-methylcytosine-specific restriction enzyme subunit McrC